MLNTWYLIQGIAQKMRQIHNLLCTCRICRPKPMLPFTCLTAFNLIFVTRRGDVKHKGSPEKCDKYTTCCVLVAIVVQNLC